MHPNPTTLSDTALAAEAADLMEQKRITSVLVVNAQQQLCGMVNSNDLMRAKVI
jgi:arabinose-5-phosphate isomerase